MNTTQIIEGITTIVNATQKVVNDMSTDDRMPIKEMAKTVGLSISVEPSVVLPFVNYFAHNSDQGYVSPGKKGGFVKGVRRVSAKSNTVSVPTTV